MLQPHQPQTRGAGLGFLVRSDGRVQGQLPLTKERTAADLGDRLVSGHGSELQVMDRAGLLEKTIEAPGHAEWLESSGSFALNSKSLVCLENDKSIEFERYDSRRCLGSTSEGDVLLGEGKTLKRYGTDLNLLDEKSMPFTVRNLESWGENTLVSSCRLMSGSAQVLGQNGEKLFETDHFSPESVRRDGDKMTFLCGKEPREAVSFWPETGKLKRLQLPARTQAAIPLKDGSTLAVIRGTLEQGPSIQRFDSEGQRLKKVDFPKEHYLRQVALDDQDQPSVVVEGKGKHTLFELDLEPDGMVGKGLGLLADSVGLPTGRTRVHHQSKPFRAARLEGGGYALFHKDGSTNRVAGGTGDKVVSRTVSSGFDRDLPADFEAHQAELKSRSLNLEVPIDKVPTDSEWVGQSRDPGNGPRWEGLNVGAKRVVSGYDVFLPRGEKITQVMVLESDQGGLVTMGDDTGRVTLFDRSNEERWHYDVGSSVKSIGLRQDGLLEAHGQDGGRLLLRPEKDNLSVALPH